MIDIQFPLQPAFILVEYQTEQGDTRREGIPAGLDWVSDCPVARLLAAFEREPKRRRRKGKKARR